MSSELNRIEGIVSELLLLTKPKEHDYRQKDVRAIIHDVIMLLESQANMNGVKIITRFDSDRTIIYCDENQIKQVIINFVKNGIEAMQNGGEMVIQVNRVGEEVVIKFSDQGCGIPEDKLAMLGQPFYTTKPKGTGLGLMISYGIIEHHKGTVSVMSKVGVGTTFVVKLPVLQHERPHVSRSRPRGNEENAI
jgi:signal transduction histidine kinase